MLEFTQTSHFTVDSSFHYFYYPHQTGNFTMEEVERTLGK